MLLEDMTIQFLNNSEQASLGGFVALAGSWLIHFWALWLRAKYRAFRTWSFFVLSFVSYLYNGTTYTL
jgi:hypothetical protein